MCWLYMVVLTTDTGDTMRLLAIDFENLHQVLRSLYQEMLPLCGEMIGVAKGIAGLGALFYVAYRVWNIKQST